MNRRTFFHRLGELSVAAMLATPLGKALAVAVKKDRLEDATLTMTWWDEDGWERVYRHRIMGEYRLLPSTKVPPNEVWFVDPAKITVPPLNLAHTDIWRTP